ncbi:MAG: hypothetical protein VKP62_16760 [Candidatus Sericytochromatia bacterium]|nr:hypothetical protein [Candidatus Sericytochromatia bacterium]
MTKRKKSGKKEVQDQEAMFSSRVTAAIQSHDPEILQMDGFSLAFIGIEETCGQPARAVYSYERMVELLVERDGLTYEDAVEYVEYNCVGAYVGPRTPAIVRNVLIN